MSARQPTGPPYLTNFKLEEIIPNSEAERFFNFMMHRVGETTISFLKHSGPRSSANLKRNFWNNIISGEEKNSILVLGVWTEIIENLEQNISKHNRKS